MVNHPNRADPQTERYPSPDEIRAARVAAGLTQVEACALVHASENAWQQWERGVRKINLAAWELFGIKVERLRKVR